MRNFCTLFDRNYLYKGLALYFSLLKHAKDFHLWVLCLDNVSFELLQKMNFQHITLVSMKEFEDEQMLKIKQERTGAEYAWTCTSNWCLYILDTLCLPEATYVDADLYFFSSPEPIFEEIGQNSIGIIEHRFPKENKKLENTLGRFNVGWVYFRNDEEGRACIGRWAGQVRQWCYNRLEDGKYGDQMYLNDWPTKFRKICVIKHAGAGLAPWNIKNNYRLKKVNDKLFVEDQPLVFYHFHAFCLENRNKFENAVGYFLPRAVRVLVYPPYTGAIEEAVAYVERYDGNFTYGYRKVGWKDKMKGLLYNVIMPETAVFFLSKVKHKYFIDQ